MRALVVIAVVAVLGVGAANAGGTSPNVRGTLVRGPITPVCIAGRSCDAPAPGVVLVFSRGSVVVKRVTTGVAGRFALRLRPGSYAVRPLRKPLVGSGLTPTRFRVPVAGTVRLTLHLDTGIN
jgi:hypothetical protein